MAHIFDYFYIVPTQDTHNGYNIAKIYGRNEKDNKVTYCNQVDSIKITSETCISGIVNFVIKGDFETDSFVSKPCIKVWCQSSHGINAALYYDGSLTFDPQILIK